MKSTNIMRKPKLLLSLLMAAALTCQPSSIMARKDAKCLKPRIVVLTDIAPVNVEPDDMESAIRLLSHADLFEIEAIITTSGWNSSGKKYPQGWMDSLKTVINAYEKDVPKLMKRSQQKEFLNIEEESKKQLIGYWPSPEYLRSRIMMGSLDFGYKSLGKDNNSAGSDFIIKLADEKDDRPLFIGLWGGGNTIAQAIWRIKQERSEAELEKFLKKIYIYAITDQDVAWGDRGKYTLSSHYWLRKEFGDKINFIWDESAWLSQCGLGSSNWNEYAKHIQGHGNLGKIYPKNKYGVEGDTPSFLHVLPNGLNNPTVPNQTGWGGYFVWDKTLDNETYCYTNTSKEAKAISQKYEKYFYNASFANFAARMDWAKYGKGNRNPIVIVNGKKGLEAVPVNTKAGSTIKLNASKSYDPDGDQLTYKWWYMPEAGNYNGKIEIRNADKSISEVSVPTDAKDKTIHIICEVTDNGEHNLKGYRRIIINVK